MLSRLRVAVLVLLAAVASATLAVAPPPAADAASVAGAGRPHLSAGAAISGKPLVFSGTGTGRSTAVLQRRTGGHWVRVAGARVGRTGHFVVRTRATLGRQQYRVVVGRRPSRTVTVNPVPAVTSAGARYVVAGRLPSTVRRPVVLQRQVGSAWTTVATGKAGQRFAITWTPGTTSTVRVLAPRTVRVTGPKKRPTRTVYPTVTGATVRLAVPSTDPTDPTGPTDPTDPTDPEVPDTVTYADLTPSLAKGSTLPHLSADGRYVAFMSTATLTEDDNNLAWDVYVRDRVTGWTELVSKDATTGLAIGANDPAISADGRYVAFVTGAANVVVGQPSQPAGQVYLYDRQTGTARMASAALSGQPNAGSWAPTVSAHGEYVAFTSEATNLAMVSDTNGMSDVFRRAMDDAKTDLVSSTMANAAKAGGSASWQPSINADGSRVAYVSLAQDLAANALPGIQQIYLWGKKPTQSVPISVHQDKADLADGPSGLPSISADGAAVAFVSVAKNLGLSNPSGRQQVHLWRETANGTTPVSAVDGAAGNWHSDMPVISGDGTRVAFVTGSTNLGPGVASGTTGVLVWDAVDGLRTVSVTPEGAAADDDSYAPSLDATGHVLAFTSEADDIVPGDGVLAVPHVLVAVLP